MDLLYNAGNLPCRSKLIVLSEFIEVTGATQSMVFELIEIGWLQPVYTSMHDMLFRSEDVYRLRKLERICMDFGLHVFGGSIIVDLLERIEILERNQRKI